MADIIEMTEEKTLVPNIICKSEFHKLSNPQKLWNQNSFVTYSDLIPSHARNIYSNWHFYQTLNKLNFNCNASFQQVIKHWKLMQYRLLNNRFEHNDLQLIKRFFEIYTYHPALYPIWFLNHPEKIHIQVLPYNWQPLENHVFKKKHWNMNKDKFLKIGDLDIKTRVIKNLNDIEVLINQSINTLIIVPELNAYWQNKKTELNAGIIDTLPLKNHILISYYKRKIQEYWLDGHLKMKNMSTQSFSDETLHLLVREIQNKAFNDIDTILINRLVKLIFEYRDNNQLTITEHLDNLFIWVDLHQASIYISNSNTMITTPKHAFPFMYDSCFMINIDHSSIDHLYFKNEQEVNRIEVAQNDNYYKAKSNYYNLQKQSLNETHFNVTDFAKFQKCPIVYTCQNKLKVKNELTSTLNMNRGIIIHAVLADFWHQVKNQSTLKKYKTYEIKSLLNKFVVKYINQIHKDKDIEFNYWEFQKKHITELLVNWINFELDRSSFKVIAVEKQIHLKFKDSYIKGRVDRIDYIDDLGYVIIDYKTGYAQSLQSTLDGFPDPQMLIYTHALEFDIAGIAYGLISTKQFKGIQFLDPDYQHMSYYDKPDVANIIESHIELFNSILKPNPFEPRQCIHCDYQSICHHASTTK